MFFFIKRREVRGEEIEPQNVLIDKLARQNESYLSESKLEVPISSLILKGVIFFFLGIILVFFFRVYQLQILRHQKYLLLAQKNEFTYHSIKAERGVIYDRERKQLVYNKPRFDLVCSKSRLSSRDLNILSQITGYRLEDLKKDIENRSSSDFTVKDLSHRVLIQAEIRKDELSACKVKNNSMRDYVDPIIFSHLLGYAKSNNHLSGLELFYDDVLKSKQGKVIIERDALGRPLKERIVSFPQAGDSLVLFIDSELQKKLFSSLKEGLESVGAKAGAAVAINPNNGAVLSLVSIPGFDSNKIVQGISQSEWEEIINSPLKPLWNRAVNGCYPSGSTIKPFIASAALEEGVITSKTKLDCPLKICLSNPYSKKEECFSDWKYHGVSDVKRALAESVNTFFYQIGGGYRKFKGLGINRIDKYLNLFNIGKKTGVDFPGESSCLLPTPDWKESHFGRSWYIGDTYNLSIGQGYLQISPLQEATAFCSIANDGVLYRPQIVKEVLDNQGKVVRKMDPVIIRQGFISTTSLRTVREGMRETVTSPSGTAHLLSDLPFSSAAKTGTAQSSQNNYYDTWITVFAPYKHPQIVLTIVMEKVKGHHFPVLTVANEVLNWYGRKVGWGKKVRK